MEHRSSILSFQKSYSAYSHFNKWSILTEVQKAKIFLGNPRLPDEQEFLNDFKSWEAPDVEFFDQYRSRLLVANDYSWFPELQRAIYEGYNAKFIVMPNGRLFCISNGEYYETKDLEFSEEKVTSIRAILFRIRSDKGLLGVIYEID